MKAKKSLLVVGVVFACCTAVWFSVSLYGSQKTYEVQPWITIPEYKTDAARAIDAYERMMERQMDITEENLIKISGDLNGVAERLDSIDGRLAEISTRIARIEKKLGIEQPTPDPAKTEIKKPQPKIPDKGTQEK